MRKKTEIARKASEVIRRRMSHANSDLREQSERLETKGRLWPGERKPIR